MLDGNYTVEDLDNYYHRLHINTVWTILTNITAIYLVCTKTTKEMGSYKYYLLLTLFCPMIMDLHISVFYGLFMTMPIGGHCTTGPARYFTHYFGTIFQYGFMHETVSWAGISLFCGMLYRYFSIKGELEKFHRKRNIVLIPVILLIYPIPTIAALYYGDVGHTLEEQVEYIRKHAPEYYLLYSEYKMCNTFTEPSKAGIYLLVAMVQIMIVYIGYIIISIMVIRLLKQVRSSLTTATYALQKQLFRALIFQCVIPLIFLAGPLWLLMMVVFLELPYAGGKNIH